MCGLCAYRLFLEKALKGFIRIIRIVLCLLSLLCQVLKYSCLHIFRGPAGFREIWEACWNRVHLSWYLSDPTVPSKANNPGRELHFPSTVPYAECKIPLLIGPIKEINRVNT